MALDEALSWATQDVLTYDGKVVSASELRAEDAIPIVQHPDGAVGLWEPVPASEQQALKMPAVEMPTTAETDLARIAELEASPFVRFVDEAVLGSDDRIRATPTNYYPRRAMIQITTADGVVCSGTLYASNKVVTAAHCLFNPDAGAWRPAPWTFELGRDGSTHNYTICTSFSNAFIYASYAGGSHGPEHDFGAVRLDCTYPGIVGNGYYPVVALPNANPQTYRDGLFVVGYPVEAQGMNVLGQQWEHWGRLIWDSSFLKTITADSSGGQSGGLWAVPCEDYGWYYCKVGPHKGDAQFLFGGMNVAHQITAGDITLLSVV